MIRLNAFFIIAKPKKYHTIYIVINIVNFLNNVKKLFKDLNLFPGKTTIIINLVFHFVP